eukprot:8026563-Heterocapsa_arctica.AAC.1
MGKEKRQCRRRQRLARATRPSCRAAVPPAANRAGPPPDGTRASPWRPHSKAHCFYEPWDKNMYRDIRLGVSPPSQVQPLGAPVRRALRN